MLLARGGLAVTVLERSTEFVDHVRGETIPPWGYAEWRESGLLDVLMAAEGEVAHRLVPYGDTNTPEEAEAAAIDASVFLPGVPGALNVSHPAACQQLLDTAETAGATVVRGVRQVQVTAGTTPELAFAVDDTTRVMRPRLVVGADGRSSTVRRQVGVELAASGPRTFGVGLLVDELDWPAGTNSVGTWDDVFFLIFPRRAGRARIYLLWDKATPSRFAGESAAERILERMATIPCLPDPSVFRAAKPIRGWASYPMEDTWTDAPYADGVVLIGDAAGYNDPIIGQGLSIAGRDARLVAAALLNSPTWTTDTFATYAEERKERMRRLRATAAATTRLRTDFTADGLRRRQAAFERFATDPLAILPIAASLVGPDALPPEAFTREAADRMLALP
ncbi:MAG: 2-polyprenyl-6-methoxyphenol hydroxylase [Frankiales bacterium]|nr:2-polyprenyl-6-methoxyphenol hydroxylase [Frankiales bacterium]